MADYTTKRKLGPSGRQQKATPGPGGASSRQQSSFQQSFKQGPGPAPYASGKMHNRARVCLRLRAPFSRAMGNSSVWTAVALWCNRCHRCFPRDHIWTCRDTERGHSCFDDFSCSLRLKPSQEADDNPTTVLHSRVVQGCHKTRSPNP